MATTMAIVALFFTFLAFVSKGAISKTCGVIAFFAFLAFLATGPGDALLNPKMPEIGEVDLPGVK